MARSLRFTEYIKKVANRAKLSERSVRKVYDAMFEIVTEELRFADEIRLKRFGTFYTVQKGGTDKRTINLQGTKRSCCATRRTIEIEIWQWRLRSYQKENKGYGKGKIYDYKYSRYCWTIGY